MKKTALIVALATIGLAGCDMPGIFGGGSTAPAKTPASALTLSPASAVVPAAPAPVSAPVAASAVVPASAPASAPVASGPGQVTLTQEQFSELLQQARAGQAAASAPAAAPAEEKPKEHKHREAHRPRHEARQDEQLPPDVIANANEARQHAARVIDVVPITHQVSQQVCEQQNSTNPQYLGAGLGGAAGAMAGSQIGNGNGRVAAAALGAIVGALTGDHIQHTPTTTCHNVTRDVTDGYRVDYERFAGGTGSVVTPTAPRVGDTIVLP